VKGIIIKLFILCFLSIGFVLNTGQAATAVSEISPDSDTVFLEHFNGLSSAEYTGGDINYVESLPGLDQAGDFSQGWARFSFYGGSTWPRYYDQAGKQGTIEMWIYPIQNESYDFFYINSFPAAETPLNGHVLYLGLNSEGKIATYCKSSIIPKTDLIPLPAGRTTIPLNKWTHIAYTWSDSGTRLYVDGKEDASSPDVLYPAFYSTQYIFVPGWEGRSIYIDEVLISRAAGTPPLSDDSNPPVTGAQLNGTPGNDGWYRSDVLVTLNAADNDGGAGVEKTMYSFDNMKWNEYTAPITIGTEGITSLYFYSADKAGITESVNKIDIKIDKTLPVITIDTPQEGAVLPAGTTLQFEASDTLSGIPVNPVGLLSDGVSTVGMSSVYQLDSSTAIEISSGYVPGAGEYALDVEASDAAGNTVRETRCFIVNNTNGGFVTGGGWINTPQGAYIPDVELTGKATFGFVSKYTKGAAVPTGSTQFQMNLADMNFRSTSYEWLVVARAGLKYKGLGSINGQGQYGFILTAVDGQAEGGGGADKFGIKIWNITSGKIVYDSQAGLAEGTDPLNVLAGGSIVIHKE
jgi:hypothetical protein